MQLCKPKVPVNQIARKATLGILRNLVRREIRANFISGLITKGWTILNPGQEPCDKWFKTYAEIKAQNNAIAKMIKKNVISNNLKEEFKKWSNWT